MAELVEQPLVMAGEHWADYGLVDSGHGRKLERYGPYRFVRPEPQAGSRIGPSNPANRSRWKAVSGRAPKGLSMS